MNIYAPHRYNKETGKYEPEVYPSIAPLVFMPEGGSVYDEIKSIKEQLNNFITDALYKIKEAYDHAEDAHTALGQLTPDVVVVSSTAPDGDVKKLWINSVNSVAYYFDGTNWKPVAGTAV